MRVLIVCSREEALNMGVNTATSAHRSTREMVFHWPGVHHDNLRGQRFDLVLWNRPLGDDETRWLRANCMYGSTVEMVSCHLNQAREIMTK